MNWITLEELALIHERVIAEAGGVHGITNPGGLESALAKSLDITAATIREASRA